MISLEETYNRLKNFNEKEILNIKILEYNGYSKKCKFKCLNCGQEFIAIPKTICQRHTRDICKNCHPYEKERSLQIKENIKEKINNNKNLEFIKFSYEYRNNNKEHKRLKVYYKCLLCGEITDIFIQDIHNKNNIICQYCNLDGHRINLNVIKKRVNEKYQGKFDIIPQDYKNGQKTIKVKCSCGFIFKTTLNSLLRDRGRLCPKCQSGYSKAAYNIYKILKENKENFVIEKTFDWLPKYRYDFYLPDKNLVIEYMGEQHYVWTKFFHKTKQDFLNQCSRDKIKREKSLSHGINYLEIPYLYEKNISSIIDNISSSTTISKESRGKLLEVCDFL